MKPIPWVLIMSSLAGFAVLILMYTTGDYNGASGTFEVIGLSVLASTGVRCMAWTYKREQQRLGRK